MKRYNIHLNEEQVEELDKILKRIHEAKDAHWSIYSLTRADLIRFAIAEVFGFKVSRVHLWGTDLGVRIREAMGKKRTKKGV